MAKSKTIYLCQNCGYETPAWYGVCPQCGAYGSFEEGVSTASALKKKEKQRAVSSVSIAASLSNVSFHEESRFSTSIAEMDRVLGGGIVVGSLVLVGGEPGIGKSTLLLQVAQNVSQHKKVLYVSGEESMQQIKLRAQRLSSAPCEMLLVNTNDLEQVETELERTKPEFVVIDSIQTMASSEISSAQGSVSQIKEVTAKLMEIAKQKNISIFVVGHVTKEGSIAGPKVLEHLVDTVIYFEGERYHSYRMLRAVKNRFGSTNELGMFEMTGKGLVEVENPSGVMLDEKPKDVAGSVVVATMEGSRPILLEVQALVSPSSFAVPRRTATGVDFNRMNMLLAVIEKKAGLHIQNQDVYINLTGGFQNSEPSTDLGIIMAVASAYKGIPVGEDTVIFGEVGLTGEIRSVQNAEKRVREAKKLGFQKVILPKNNCREKMADGICTIGVENIFEALKMISVASQKR